QPRNLSVTWNDVASTQRTGKPASRRGAVASCNASRTSSGRFSAANSLIIPARAGRSDALRLVGDQFQCDVAEAQRLDLGRERRQDSGRFARRLDRRDLGLVPRGAHHGALDAPLAEQPHYGGDAGGDVHHRTAWRRTRGSPSFSAPRRYPSTSSKTRSKPTSRSSRASAPACAIARSISTGATSIRAASPWWRTRNSRKPRRRIASSAASTCRSRSGVTESPYGNRLARHGADGWSHVGSPRRRDSSRISAFVSPASRSGERTPNSCAARIPGRWSPASSAFEPSSTTAYPRAAARAVSFDHNSVLQK